MNEAKHPHQKKVYVYVKLKKKTMETSFFKFIFNYTVGHNYYRLKAKLVSFAIN